MKSHFLPRSFWSLAACLALSGGLAAPGAAEPAARLVKNLQQGSRDEPVQFRTLARFGELLVASGRDGAHGIEPWISDGSAAGTRRLADVAPGPTSSEPANFVALGESLLFTASDGFSVLLWAFEGGLAGGEVEPLIRLPRPAEAAAALGGNAYYFVRDDDGRLKLFESDGSAEGTRISAALCTYPFCSGEPPRLFAHGGALYVGFGSSLYRLAEGEEPVEIAGLSGAGDFVALDAGRFVMRAKEAADYSAPFRLWVSDGTAGGTFALDPPGQELTVEPHTLVAYAGRVYAVNGNGAVISVDGTAAGTRLEPSFPAGPRLTLLAAADGGLLYDSEPLYLDHHLRVFRGLGGHVETGATSQHSFAAIGKLGGSAVLSDSDYHLWRSNGNGATLVGELFPAGPGVELSGALHLAGYVQGVSGAGLYRLGPSGALAAALTRISTPLGSDPRPFAIEGGLIAAANTPSSVEPPDDEYYLWRVDPLSLDAAPVAGGNYGSPLMANGEVFFAQTFDEGGPQLVAVGPATETRLPIASKVAQAAVRGADGALLYSNLGGGQTLFRSDGTLQGTQALFEVESDWVPYPYCGVFTTCWQDTLPAEITPVGDKTFFIADSRTLDFSGPELWVQPGPGEPPVRLLQLPAAPNPAQPYPRIHAVLPGKVIVVVPRPDAFLADYVVSDGSLLGTYPLLVLPDTGSEAEPAAFGSRFVFTRNVTGHPELGFADTASLELFAGPDGMARFTAAGNQVFFRAGTAEHGAELWRSDGTAIGTRQLDLRPGLASSLAPDAEIYALDETRVVFAADAGDGAGNELFVSDGTFAGTIRLTDIAPGEAASNPRHFLRSGGRLFFSADDGDDGAELWVIDLPPARPACPPEKLCLLDGRFEAEVTATTADGVFQGRRALAGAESGIFTFFGPNNWEMMVKLLYACSYNHHFWVFSAAATDVAYELRITDRATGLVRTYTHAAGSPAQPLIDLEAFAACDAPAPSDYAAGLPLPEPARRCLDGGDGLCLGRDGRFRVKASWRTAAERGTAKAVPYGSLDSGLFTFFSSSNWELLVKVLDGCAWNGRHWIYAAGTTDVGWRLEVEDLVTHETKFYESELGQPSRTITDADALGGCP